MMGFFRRWVLHNFWLKVLSLLLATGLWLAISPDQEPAEVAVRVPIEFRARSAASGDQLGDHSRGADPGARAGANDPGAALDGYPRGT